MNISLRLGQMNKMHKCWQFWILSATDISVARQKVSDRNQLQLVFFYFRFSANLFSEWQHKQGKEGRKSIGEKPKKQTNKIQTWDEL